MNDDGVLLRTRTEFGNWYDVRSGSEKQYSFTPAKGPPVSADEGCIAVHSSPAWVCLCSWECDDRGG